MTTPTVAVFGANGRSGRVFVAAALSAGYKVRAGVHHGELAPAKNLISFRCDATNNQEVAEVLSGCDYAVSLLGHVPKSHQLMQTNAINTIAHEMQKQDIKRLVSLTGTGVRIAGDKPSIIDYMANFVIKLIDPHRINDGIQHVRALESTTLDWTVIRVLKLANSTAKPYHLTPGGPAKLLTSREEVASAILAVLNDASTYQTYPIIS